MGAILARNFAADRAKLVRRSASGTKQGCGDDRHVLSGSSGSGTTELRHRTLMRFAPNWADMAKIVKIELAMKTETNQTVHWGGGVGSAPRIRIVRLTAAFSEGTGAENVWTTGEYEWPGTTGGVEYDASKQDELWQYFDITTLAKGIVPKTILMPDGTPGAGGTNYGFAIRSPGDELNNAQRMSFRGFHDSTSANRPYLRVTYEAKNRAPSAPTTTAPNGDTTFAASFEGQHVDPDLDQMSAREIIVYPAGGSTPTWTLPASLQTAGSDETQSGLFSVPLSLAIGALKSLTAYEWVARTKDGSGLWGPYSARRPLRITSTAPTVVASTFASPVESMAGARFGGTYSDPESNPLANLRLQMRLRTTHDETGFADPDLNVWDTGEVPATTDEVTSGVIARAYGGYAIDTNDYTYRIAVQDTTGLWSPWSYADFTFTGTFDPDPGSVDLLTQVARNAPVRIALYKMDANRGPGALIGYIDDPINLGASGYLNAGGEVYFTLPALHPYCPEVEPHRTHYMVEQYYGDRYRVLFAGIITDFDAVADEMVAYGTDYLGLLQTAVDERYDPTKPDVPSNGAGGGGSKYVDKTIDYVIRDQLTYHKNSTNSPVKFIAIGPLSVLTERVTIYSTYSECLPFITGLIDSHKQGTGKECRFYARPSGTDPKVWEWRLTDNWGKDRPNIRLEYGGLLNDFRVVALGDFGTRVLGVGQKRGEVKVYRATGTGGLDESDWGRRAQTRFYADIIDQNDLNRRVKEDAAQLAKVGKRMALAIRADVLSPFDGWDIGDSIVIDIERGVVDTSRYGSEGLWTIYGVEWRYYPDGHTDMTLTVLPKKGLESPDPDLIPSINPGVPKEWQTGYGVPTQYGEPPQPTPTTPIPTFFNDYGDFTYEWRFNTGTTPPPAQGAFKSSVSTPTLDFDLYFSQFSRDDIDRSLEFSSVVPGTRIYIRLDGSTEYWVGQVRLAPIDNGDYWTFPITRLSEGVETLPPNNAIAAVTFLFRGNETYYPPTADPVTAKWYEDLNTGYVYELVEDTGQYRLVYTPQSGGTAPVPVDTEPPPIPVLKSLVSVTSQQQDSTTLTGIGALVGYNSPPAGLIDLARIEIQTTRFSTENPDPEQEALPNWTVASIWSNASADKTGTLDTYVVASSVLAATRYWVRARAIDDANNRSSWTDYQTITTAEDTDGPPRPSNIVVRAGMSTLGIRWDDIEAVDLSYCEVEWRVSPDGNWESARLDGTLIVVTGLVNDTAYEVRMRSVDTSGNTLHDTGTVDTEGNPIYETFKASDREKGWVEVPGTFTPTAIPGDTLVWDEAIIENVFAGMINADWITAGTLTVGNGVDGITVVDALGNVVGRWNPNGLEVLDPANPQYFLRITESSLIIWDTTDPLNPIERVRLTPRGIDAASITFGSARGGHNLIQNSSFELGRYGVTAITENVWDVQSDWDASRIGSDTNVTTGASTLTMTSVT